MMKKKLYNAAAEGDIEALERLNSEDKIEFQETPLMNTVLHVAVQVASARNYANENKEKTMKAIKKICELCPSLIQRRNSKGDTPLHIAARGGRSDVVEQLIKCDVVKNPTSTNIGSSKSHHEDVHYHENENGSVVRMVNLKKDTALHEALRNHHLFHRKYHPEFLKVVEMLIKEDAELSNLINDAGESPVFIAAREGLNDFLEVLLRTSSEYGGPGKRTALHAAVLLREEGEKIGEDGMLPVKTGGITPKKGVLDIIEQLMKNKPDLIKKEDDYKQTPLHYAANLHKKDKDSHEKVQKLLDLDPDEHKSVVYHRDFYGMTALHYAARSGANKSIDVLIQYCPDCFEQVDNKGWTTLHFAVAGERSRSDDSTIKYIIKNKNVKLRSISMAMVNQPDDKNGDTPLHLAARLSNYDALSFLMDFPEVDKRALNNENLTTLDIVEVTGRASDVMGLEKKSLAINLKKRTGSITSQAIKDTQQGGEVEAYEEGNPKTRAPKTVKELMLEEEEKAEIEIGKLREIELVVATLIATVTFAASFTMPGGYNEDRPDEGMATLSSEAAFQLFVIANTGAMALSTAAIFTHLNAVMTMFDRRKPNLIDRSFTRANLFIVIAIIGMVIAFVTGTHLVLANNSALAIRSTVIGCCLFFGPVGPRLLISLTKYCSNYLYQNILLKALQALVFCCCCIFCCCSRKDDSHSMAGDQEEKKPALEKSAHEV